METITLETTCSDNTSLKAVFAPSMGMSLLSYQKAGQEVLAGSTKKDFDTRRGGLGVMIGPHFHQRNKRILPHVDNIERFFQVPAMKKHGSKDYFSHGVGRYAPWQYTHSSNAIQAKLTGEDIWEGIALKEIEGQNFVMTFDVLLTAEGLCLTLSSTSDTDSVVGIHYYYNLPDNTSYIQAQVKDYFLKNQIKTAIDTSWDYEHSCLKIPLEEDIDFTFYPWPNPLEGTIHLHTSTHELITHYQCPSAENCWQLWHPKQADFVCIEPISAKNPRKANLSVNQLAIRLEIR